ncbi:hypothetical protein OA852_00625 [SAR86 cluster bacterium]|mgnify:FL=1|nr:hypothetical protein [SAR86 cluster bacterium]
MNFIFLWVIWSLVSYFVVQIVSYERVSEIDRNKNIEILACLVFGGIINLVLFSIY